MKTAFKKISIALLIVAFALTLATSFAACNKKKDTLPDVNYAITNNFEITTTDYTINPEAKEDERIGARIYAPNGVNAKYGVLFFPGTITAPEYYDYLCIALAKQGYFVATPALFLASLQYDTTTKPIADAIIAKYPNLKFFVGGHSQGGGAAIRFACEHLENTLGAILFAPYDIFASREITREEYDKDCKAHPEWFYVNGDKIYRTDTLANTNLPTLILEADKDHVLIGDAKNDAINKTPSKAMFFELKNACHMGFSTWDFNLNGDGEDITQEQKEAQRALTISYVLDFLQITVANK